MQLIDYIRSLLGKEYYDSKINFELKESAIKEGLFKINSKEVFTNGVMQPFDEGVVYHFIIESDTFVMTDFTQSKNFRDNKIYHYDKSAEKFNYILTGLTEKYFLNKKLNAKLPEKNDKTKRTKI